MFDARRKSMGVNHTTTVTSRIVAFISSTRLLAALRSRSLHTIGTVE
jgi:hypothetical protein